MEFYRQGNAGGTPESTTLFRNPAAGADITAFTMSHSVKDIICLTHHNILFLHIKQKFLHLSVVDCGTRFRGKRKDYRNKGFVVQSEGRPGIRHAPDSSGARLAAGFFQTKKGGSRSSPGSTRKEKAGLLNEASVQNSIFSCRLPVMP
jgi:hypothetical protein